MLSRLTDPDRDRRRLLALAASAVPPWLAACGGGSGSDEPSIDLFAAERERYAVGERAAIVVRYRGHSARLEPGLGAVSSGSRVLTPPLDTDATYTLTVEAAGAPPLSRSLTLPVAYRDRYQPQADHQPLSGHAAATLPDGSVLLIGGSRGQRVFAERIDRFDPATGRLQPLATMAQGRSQALAVVLSIGGVLIGAGATSGFTGRELEWLDPVSGRVTAAGLLSVPRLDAAAVALPQGRVLYAGGVTAGEGGEFGLSASAEIWDPQTRSTRRLASRMTVPRAGHTMVRLADGRVLVAGGWSTASPYRYAELFEPATERFVPLNAPPMPPLAQQVAVLQPDGTVLLLGGEHGDGTFVQPRAEVRRFDPRTDTFSARPPLARARTLAAGVGLRNGQVLLFGGQTEASGHTASAECYDPVRGGRAIAALDQDRAYLSASRLPDGRVLVAGGETRDGLLASSLLVYE